MSSQTFSKLNILLSKWFESYGRDFPWRHTNNLYKILISEILLRKTNAEMVSAFFKSFIDKYPNFQEINQVDEQELEQDLVPLGLYKTRTKILKKIAYQISNEDIPKNNAELIKLYGIGHYIANAVICFGLGKDVVLLDTNINRILSRLLDREFPKRINIKHPLYEIIKKCTKFQDKKTFYMALIDLGALICKERGYRCSICPIYQICNYSKKIVE